MSAAAVVAGIGVLGSVGANALTDVLLRTVRRWQEQGEHLGQEVIEDELAVVIEEALLAGDAIAEGLRTEVAAVLREIDGASAALEAVVECEDADIQSQLVAALGSVEVDFVEFGFVLADARAAATAIQETLRRQDVEHRADRDRARSHSLQLRLLRDELAVIELRTRDNASPEMFGADSRWSDGAPYRGLHAFNQDHERVYYGRERLTAKLVDRAGERLTGLSLVVVTGASGAGKSSLLQAGFIPAVARGLLVDGSESWPLVLMTPTPTPLDELATRLAVLGGMQVSTLRDVLAKRPDQAPLLIRQAVLAAAGEQLTGSSMSPRLLLVVDQFEQLFTLANDDPKPGQREPFLTALRAAAGTPVGAAGEPAALVVLGVRGDFWDRCAALPQLADALDEGQFVVGPMSEPDLRRAITGPAAAADLDIERGLTDTVLDDLRSLATPTAFEVGALPLLSQAMLITWANRDGNRLTLRGYGLAGGVAHAVATSAEHSYFNLTEPQRDVARRLLCRMTVITEDGQVARRPTSRQNLQASTPGAQPGDVQAVLDAFADVRLITFSDSVVEIAHDALLYAWPRLQDWLADSQADRLLFGRLTAASSRWQTLGRDSSLLPRGAELTTLRQAAARWDAALDDFPGLALDPDTRAFLAAGSRAARRSTRLRQAAIALVVILLIATGTFAVVAVRNAAREREQRDLALSLKLLAQADTARATDPRLAARLGLAATRIHETDATRASLIHTVSGTSINATLAGHTGEISSVAFAPNRRILATGGSDNTAILWDISDQTRPVQIGQPLIGHTASLSSVVFTPDGRTLITASFDKTAILWDVTDPARPTRIGEPLTGHTDSLLSLAVAPDGRTLVTAGRDGTAMLWDIADRTRPTRIAAPLTGHTAALSSVAFAPDGHTLATGSADKTVILWDVTDRARPTRIGAPLTGHTDQVWAVAFAPAGSTLATAGRDNTVILWDVSKRSTPTRIGQPLTGHLGPFASVAFAPNGHTLAAGSLDKTVTLWEVSDPTMPTPLGQLLTGHTASVVAVAFAPDGRTLATASRDETAILWDVTDLNRPSRIGQPLTGHTDGVTSVAFAPDGRTLATASLDKTVILWDLASLSRPTRIGQPLTGHHDYVVAVAFSPDGRTLATASRDGTAILWDITNRTAPTRIAQLTDHNSAVYALAFAPNGRTLATASRDETVIMWDIADRTAPFRIGKPLTERAGPLYAVAFAPNGRTLAAAGADNTTVLWDITDQTSPTHIGRTTTYHTDAIASVAFAPDGRTIATASYDGTAVLWDLTDMIAPIQLGSALTRHTASVFSLTFAPDGRTLATASDDKTIQLWDLSSTLKRRDHAEAWACAIAGGGLNPQEWTSYLPALPYQNTCPSTS